MFVSDIGNKPIIESVNRQRSLLFPEGVGRGYEKRNWERWPHGAFAAKFPLPTIPRSEWPDRIEELTKRQATLPHAKRRQGWQSLSQGRTNYCWINAVIAAQHYLRAIAGLPHVPLSPASVGAKIKNFRNVGGWGSEGLEYVIEHGAVPQALWPANAIDRRYDTPEADEARQRFRVPEWWELRPKNFDELMTALLLGFPVPIGLLWWRHEVCAVAPLVLGRDAFGVEIDNSWGASWGEDGHGVLTETKAKPDDAVCPRVVTPSPQ